MRSENYRVSGPYYYFQLSLCNTDPQRQCLSQPHALLPNRIRLLRLNEQSGEWAQESEWRAHDAPITRIAWAHPEHGALLASSSFDRSVKVWQEAERVHGSSGGGSAAPRWIERAVLTEAKGGVRDVCFAPTYFGLKLVSGSSFVHLGCLGAS